MPRAFASKAPLEHRASPCFGVKCRVWVWEQVWLVPLVASGQQTEQLLHRSLTVDRTLHLDVHRQLSRELFLRCTSPGVSRTLGLPPSWLSHSP
jgi:hypothetical protein